MIAQTKGIQAFALGRGQLEDISRSVTHRSND